MTQCGSLVRYFAGPPAPSACELANFGPDVRMQVGHPPLVNPIEWDAVGGELERLIGWDAHHAGFVGAPRCHVGSQHPRHLELGEVERPARKLQAGTDLR